MKMTRLWSWEFFDRCIGVFAALCGAAGAYFTYRAAYPQTSPTTAVSGGPMTAGAPWWALTLLALALILLVVSFTRRRNTGVERDRLENIEKRLDWVFTRQRDHISTPELAQRLDREIVEIKNAVSALSNDEAQRLSAFKREIASLVTQNEAARRDLEKLLSLTWALSARAYFSDTLRQEPSQGATNDEVREFISTCEIALNNARRYDAFRNIMKNAEKKVQEDFERAPPKELAYAENKMLFIKQEIARQQARYFADYLRSQINEFDGFLYENVSIVLDRIRKSA